MLMSLLALLYLSNVFVQGQGSSSAPVPTQTTGMATGTATGSATAPSAGAGTSTGGPSGSATGTGSAAPSATALPPITSPLGSLMMLFPKANNQNPPIFPIGVDIEFSWEYNDYLIVQPKNLTIEAYSPDNTIVTIGDNLPGNLKSFIWTGPSQKNITHPIKTAIYTLRIFDGAIGRFGSLPNAGGYLSTYTGLKFGLYGPGGYTPSDQLNPPICATCEFSTVTNGAFRTVLPALPMALAILISAFMVLQ
ncbi:hypothetical protein BG011_006051 [Mortierella polycephala]|uniref:DUF7137 domain-containing protein n=1 Tax=Mortierella polycephala TaxID=41804 RepID=A0A9P6PX37_9FUNG|nr:hypothetical protein BG011_006051 [Mortierella polycephala]